MKITLKPQLQRQLEKQVAQGRFDSLETAVNELVQAQLQDSLIKREDVQALRKEIVIGLRDFENGNFAPWDPDEIWADVEAASAKARRRAG